MTFSRRGLLRHGAGVVGGIALAGCNVLDTARPQQGADPIVAPDNFTAPGPVLIEGRHVRTIDVHAHCYVSEALALLGADADGVLPPVKGVKEHFIVVEDRLRAMDAMRIDMEILSINPFWYRRDRSLSERIVRVQNEKMAEFCAVEPRRLGAFASLSLQYPDLAVRELEDAVTRLGLKGVAIGASVAGSEFSNPKFFPVWARAEELGATLFIHPQSTPELASRFKGNGWLSNVIGNPLDTTIALQHLIFQGTLDRFPKLKICAAHGGGFLPSNAARGDRSCFVSPQNCDPNIVLKKKPAEYVSQIYFDALVFTPEALRHLVAQVGASQIVLGSDHPIPWEEHPVDHVLNTPSLSAAERVAILGDNARRLLDLPA
ncbi:MAG: amidohydrolase [Pseudomonadota bacterium]|nr:amidohydrolase [Pseudomonadota bacterium]